MTPPEYKKILNETLAAKSLLKTSYENKEIEEKIFKEASQQIFDEFINRVVSITKEK